MNITITKKAFYLLYFTCFFALLLAALPLSNLLRIPGHLRKWFGGCIAFILMWLHIFLAMKGWLAPMMARTTQAESHTLRLSSMTIDVISVNARLTIWRRIVFALAILFWGGLIGTIMVLFSRIEVMLPLILLLMGTTLAMMINYVEKKWNDNLP